MLHGDHLPICVLTHKAMKGKLCFVYQMHFTREQTAKQMRQKEVNEYSGASYVIDGLHFFLAIH